MIFPDNSKRVGIFHDNIFKRNIEDLEDLNFLLQHENFSFPEEFKIEITEFMYLQPKKFIDEGTGMSDKEDQLIN